MAVERKRGVLEAAGQRLAFERLRPETGENGPTLVFLHEGLGSIAQWKDFPEVMVEATGLPALVYERRGHGGSDALEGMRGVRYLHDEALRVLPEVIRAAGVREAVLIGHSDGGTIALLYAGTRPEGLRGVVTEAAHVFVEDVTLEGIRATVRAYEEGDLGTKLARHHGEKTERLFRVWAGAWLSAEFRGWNIEAELRGIACPVLAIQGAEDEYGTPMQLQKIEAGCGSEVKTLLVEECGHAPHHQAREVVVGEVVEFVKRW